MVDLDPNLLQAKGLSPSDVVNAIGNQNLILPTGTSKIGQFEYDVGLNASTKTVEELNDLPVSNSGTIPYTSGTLRTCAMDLRLRPTSSAGMASAACCW